MDHEQTEEQRDDPLDLVISYTVGANGYILLPTRLPSTFKDSLNIVLRKGYRVVDVLQAAVGDGDNAFICVTVVLTRDRHWIPYRHTHLPGGIRVLKETGQGGT